MPRILLPLDLEVPPRADRLSVTENPSCEGAPNPGIEPGRLVGSHKCSRERARLRAGDFSVKGSCPPWGEFGLNYPRSSI